ncbi:MAG: hypothetical protein ABEJ96_00805, partial [Thiohalorhabdaceae bacterium]
MTLGILTAAASAVFATMGNTGSFAPQPRNLSLSMQPGLSSPSGEAALQNPLAFSPEKQNQKETADEWNSYTLNKGETLSQLGERTELGRQTAMELARASADIFPARKMRAGHTLRVRSGEDGQPQAVHYQIDQGRYLAWEADGNGGFGAEVADYPRTVQVREAFGRIRTSLFQAGRRAGLSDKTIMELARIYSWDIDLAHDIR